MRAVVILLALLFAACNQPDPNLKRASFKVWGNCEMCKKTIERSLPQNSIKNVSWNIDTKIITVDFDSTKISLKEVQEKIAAAGYDNVTYKGNDSAYTELPECCQYDRKEK